MMSLASVMTAEAANLYQKETEFGIHARHDTIHVSQELYDFRS